MDPTVVSALIGGLFTLFGVWLNHRLTVRQVTLTAGALSNAGSHPAPHATQPEAISTPQSAVAAPAAAVSASGLRIGAIIRDVGIIQMLAAVAGFIVGATSGATTLEELLLPLLVSVLIANTAGFLIAGMLTESSLRRRHLMAVAVGVWLINTLITGLTGMGNVIGWILNAVLVAIAMLAGGFFANQVKKG